MPKARPADEGLPDWFATFADMMTLLMTFFVLLFSMSTLDPVKIADLAASMEGNLSASGKLQAVKIKTQSQIKREINEAIEKMQVNYARVTSSPKGTTITIDSQFAFQVGEADLMAAIFPFLDSIIPIIADPGNKFPVAVEGHTDNQAPVGAIAVKYPTNWELSGARAANVVRYFITKGVPSGRLRAVGFADQVPYGTTWYEFRQGVTEEMVRSRNSTRVLQAANRRVEITFLQVG